MCQLLFEAGEPLLNVVVAHRKADGLFGADEYHKPLAAGDAGVEQVAVEHLEMAHVDRDDHAGALAALIFVDRDGVGEDEIIDLRELVLDALIIKTDG